MIESAYDWQEYNEAMAPKIVATLQMGGLQIHAILPVREDPWGDNGFFITLIRNLEFCKVFEITVSGIWLSDTQIVC